jgi:hypothetical protein
MNFSSDMASLGVAVIKSMYSFVDYFLIRLNYVTLADKENITLNNF